MPGENVTHVGLRTRDEIAARIALLADEAETPPIAEAELTRLRALEQIEGPAREAVAKLKALEEGASAARLSDTLDAIADRGYDPATLRFQASFGLTSLEYYSGFVFGFTAKGQAPAATGGRYDLLTAALNGGTVTPAVGGVVRPEVVLTLRSGK